jgi:hypothetical protein
MYFKSEEAKKFLGNQKGTGNHSRTLRCIKFKKVHKTV